MQSRNTQLTAAIQFVYKKREKNHIYAIFLNDWHPDTDLEILADFRYALIHSQNADMHVIISWKHTKKRVAPTI
ncbi:hypothetical protein P343_12165 [Sporolactobacillus laevolacticus DSM 442]|uniref:Uncharacterized protein n=1 Tax=Sporolactobacillus laevolacticus DSM 442 TaxID=1395513 RepID=V6IXK7_9BACL|nr:hypothetical protein P343_12165 [Sporolactobacillus laevolacticus DSM 442]